MNPDVLLWTTLFLMVCTALLALPFWPAWAEWRHPQDLPAMPVPEPAEPRAAAHPLRLPAGARFEHLQAARILLGQGTPGHGMALPPLVRWQPPPDARPWGECGWRIPHDLHVPAGHLVPCTLVVNGRFTLEGPGRITGDIKARKTLHIGAGSRIDGQLLSEGDIRLDAHSRVSGVVMAEGRLQLSPHVVIGSPRLPVSVCADVIDAHGPVQVHGTLQARVRGQVRSADSLHPST
jgi:hypothetical protein